MKNTPLIIKQQQLHLITRQLRAKEREKRDLENKICVLKGLRLSIDYSNDDFHSASKSQIFFFCSTLFTIPTTTKQQNVKLCVKRFY